MFPRLPAHATFVADTNFVSRTQRMFLILFRNILCPQQMFPSLRSPRNIMGNNMSATMCPRLAGPLGRHACVLGPRRRFMTEGQKKQKTKTKNKKKNKTKNEEVKEDNFNLRLSLWEAQVTNWGKQTFIYQAAKDWNSLPTYLKETHLSSIFKVVLRPKTTKKIILFFFGFQNYVN